MVMKIGMIGLSDGNGHPFSFSAIVNGYDDAGMAASDWPVIHDYLKAKDESLFGFDNVRVTHAWTQDIEITKKLCAASKIDNACNYFDDMLNEVDAVIIARDDWKSHMPYARTFLDHGLPVFIDKPLTLDKHELDYFSMFLESGKLMSCSGLRHAVELDAARDIDFGQIKCINGVVLIDWPRYGVHLLDAAFTITKARPISVARNVAEHDSYTIAMNDGSTFTIDAIGMGPKTFHLDFYGDKARASVEMNDNFMAFRGTLEKFINMANTGAPAVPPEDTLCIMKTLMAGLKADKGGGHVKI